MKKNGVRTNLDEIAISQLVTQFGEITQLSHNSGGCAGLSTHRMVYMTGANTKSRVL